jgi:hypothetical protein
VKWFDALLIGALVVSTLPISGPDAAAEALSSPAEAQDSAEAAPAGQAPAAEADDQAERDEFERMEAILRAEEDMIQGSYSYEAGRRRDPFVSLLRPRETPRPGATGLDCPIGCLIGDITLTGIFVMPEGPVAQILSPDHDKSYLIRVGDEFHDGDVIAITRDGVRFRQIVNDFQEMKPYREVYMELNP